MDSLSMQEREKRREDRIATNERVTFEAAQKAPDSASRGVIVNISSSGMGLYHYGCLSEGDTIRIRDIISNLCSSGVVRWVQKLDDVSCLAGIQCRKA